MVRLQHLPINPPFPVDFKNSDKRLLRAHFEWFVAQIPERIRALQRAIDASLHPPFKLDLSRESLLALGRWLASVVETRELTLREIAEWQKTFPSYIKVPKRILSEQAEFLGIDVGIYMAEVMRYKCPALTWDVLLKNKRHAEYGKPVLVGFAHGVVFEADEIGRGMARKIANHREQTDEIAKTFDFWLKHV
jgi:hypothetical protein